MFQPKDIDWLNGYNNIYAINKTPTSDMGTHTDWKWGDEKVISWKWKLKESWSSNTHMRQKKQTNKKKTLK